MSAGHSPAAVRLTAADVYPSAGILGARVSPDGSLIGLIYRSFKEVSLDGEELRTRTLADLQLIPADGGPARPVFGGGETITSVAWSPLAASTLAV